MKCNICCKPFTPSNRTLKRACYRCTRALRARRKSQGGNPVRQSLPMPPWVAAGMAELGRRAGLGLPLFVGKRV